MFWLYVIAGLVVGYTIGRVQPYRRLGDWANWQLSFRLNRWNSSYSRQAVLFTLLLITDPVNLVRAWRDRHQSRRTTL